MHRSFEGTESQCVVLIGYRGTGKSALVKHMAREFDAELVTINEAISNDDTDAIVDILYMLTAEKPRKSLI
jgi:MoxR-like ATPase